MIRSLIHRRLAKEERRLGGSLDYLRQIVKVSISAFLKFVKLMPLANHRKVVPPDVYHVARLVATQHEDCGGCLQIEVNLAKKAGLADSVIQAVLDGEMEQLTEPLAEAHRFCQAVVRATYDEEELRERLRQRYGEKGLIDLAFGITVARAFPTTKRALGFAKSCSATKFEH